MNIKFKSPLFWVSMISIIFAAGGVTFESLTSWPLLMDGMVKIAQNPVALLACIVAAYGVWNDNGVKK